MPVVNPNYTPSLIFRNGHLNSFISNKLRYPKVTYTRQRLNTPDGDFLDVDWIKGHDRDTLVVLCHGLEGSSQSTYIRGLALTLDSDDMDVLAMNYRGCSGETNRTAKMYHSGFTEDLDFVLKEVEANYASIVLIGYSLGGNVVLKYLGEQGEELNPKIKLGFAVSVPTSLSPGAHQIDQTIYKNIFLPTLKQKAFQKAKFYPDLFEVGKLKSVNTVVGFDDLVTGPIHGFDGAEDYYSQSASGQFIEHIAIETHIFNALDDPFFPIEEHPITECQLSNNVHLHLSKHGGHVGFWQTSTHSYIDTVVPEIIRKSLFPLET